MMQPPFSFNLVDEPWIPCLRFDGTVAEYSIRETLARAHRLRAIAGETPLVTASLHRFLLAILHRVFGPASYDAWADLWQAGQWDLELLGAYLDVWRHRFDLFDAERPFYQWPDPRVKPKSTISLSHEKASGNNPTLFDQHTETAGEALTAAQATRALITAQAFGLAGLSGIKQKFTDGTCAGGIIFLVEGRSLWETQLLNMIRYPDETEPFRSTERDAPAWEMDDPFSPEREYPFGYLDYLTWQNRRVLFLPQQDASGAAVVDAMTMGPGLRFDPSLLDPFKHYRPDKKLGHVAISFREARALWRDSATLFSFEADIEGKYRPPAILHWLHELVEEDYLARAKAYQCIALGMSKKQAKVSFFQQEELPLPLDYLVDVETVSKLKSALQVTETIGFDLRQALRTAGMHLQLLNADESKWQGVNSNARAAIDAWVAHTGAERHYWASLDLPFHDFMVDLPSQGETALARWYGQTRRAALDAYDKVSQYVGEGGRSYKAVVRGRQYLYFLLNKALPVKEKAS